MSGRTTHYTAELRKAKTEGAVIVCAVAPYRGKVVHYIPRGQGDPRPWVLATGDYRYNGRECMAVDAAGRSWTPAETFQIGGTR